MNKIYYLPSCSSCRKIIKTLPRTDNLQFHDIKQHKISVEELEMLYNLAGSYEALFNKKAQLYKERNLKNKTLLESDYKSLLLEHYTFLKRPVFIIENKIFIGNDPKNIQEVILVLK